MSTNPSQTPAAPAGQKPGENPHKIEVAVVTTSGTYPQQGYDELPLTEPIKVELERAVKKLGIKDTTGWIARVGTRELNPAHTYAQEGLSGKVDIDYGPREGGGGRE